MVGRAIGVEQGFLHTVARLTVAPASVTRGYLEGRTRPYTHPLAYLALGLASFALAEEFASGHTSIASGDNALFTGVIVLFIAAVSRLFDRRGLNYAEHLIVTMYLVGHVALIFTIAALVTVFAPPPIDRAAALVAAIVAIGYFVWGYSGSIGRRRLVSAIMGLVSLCGGIVLWGLVIYVVVQLFRR